MALNTTSLNPYLPNPTKLNQQGLLGIQSSTSVGPVASPLTEAKNFIAPDTLKNYAPSATPQSAAPLVTQSVATPHPVAVPSVPTTQPIATAPITPTVSQTATTQPPPIQGQPQLVPTGPSFQGIVGGLLGASQPPQQAQNYTSAAANIGAGAIPIAQQGAAAVSPYAKQIADLANLSANEQLGIETGGAPAPIGYGNAALIAGATGQKLQGLAQAGQLSLAGTQQQLTAQQQAEQAAQNAAGLSYTGQQQQIGGLAGAAGIAAPSVGQAGQVFYNPLTAGAQGGTPGAVPLTGVVATDIGNISQAVANGTLDYQSGLGQLSGYGTAVQNQLMPAIQKLNPNFNFNLSASSAQTQALGQQIQTQATSANQALDTLQNLFQSLPVVSQTGLPFINKVANTVESFLGSSQLSAYKTALADGRAQLEGVLTATGATTPTGAAEMAQTYLPDNMTPGQLQENIATVKQLIGQKVSSFVQSGQQPSPTTSAGGGSSTTNAGGGGWDSLTY